MTVTDDAPRSEGSVVLAGGRAVGFAEWGDPDGHPVVVFHGGPGSRLFGVGCEALAGRLGLRMVCLERPGFGRSDYVADRTVLGWVDDVAEVITVLGIDRFVVVGVSAGSPYALACAARPASGLGAVGVIAGLVPAQFSTDDEFSSLVERDRTEAEAAARRHFEVMAADVDGSARAMATREGPDRKILERPEVQQQFAATRREAFRHGVDGAVLDLMLVHEPWGFDLKDVAVNTRWWHGELDPVAPLASVRAATAATPIELTVYEDEGHAINVAHGAEILTTLVATSQAT
jgi:pimeloyl-ACP methyl ester carboxylesterase